MNENLLYEEIYQKTQDCGRTQFVKLLQQNQIKIEQLQKENEELVRLVTNKIISNYDYDSVLKKQLSEERLSYIALSESKHILENILTEFENWLEEKINSPKLSLIEIITFKRCLEKLQEIERGR